jgi:ferredoxin-NADP reductase
LYLKPTDNKKYDFEPGQYVDIKPTGTIGHGKSYTISSVPDDKLVRLTIKRKGAFSSALIDFEIGHELVLDGPYGNFYPEKGMKDVVMFAGGIGVTPFYSIIKNKTAEKGDTTKMTLFYSNKTIKSTTFFDGLNKLENENNNLNVIYFITQEKTASPLTHENTRINKKGITKHIASISNKCYYVCGSIGFVDDVWRILKELGIPEELIYTESFY